MKDTTSSRYSSIGFDEKPTDDHMTKLSRVQMVTWACYSGVDDCRLKSTKTLKDILEGRPVKYVYEEKYYKYVYLSLFKLLYNFTYIYIQLDIILFTQTHAWLCGF